MIKKIGSGKGGGGGRGGGMQKAEQPFTLSFNLNLKFDLLALSIKAGKKKSKRGGWGGGEIVTCSKISLMTEAIMQINVQFKKRKIRLFVGC